MKKKLIRTVVIISLVTVLVIAFSMVGFAAGDITKLKTPVNSIITGLKTVAGVVVVFSAVVTAAMYMLSVVNPGLKDTAKKGLVALIIGVVILAFAESSTDILNGFLGQDLLTK